MATPALVPAPVPEVPAETQIRQPAPVVASKPAGLETLLRSLLSGQMASVQQPRQRSFRRDWNAVVCFSCGKAGHSATRCPTLDETFPFMLLEGREDTGWLHDDFTPGGSRASSSGKRQLIRGEGFTARISSKVRPQDPGGGAARIAVPREVMDVEMRSLSMSSIV